MFRSTLIVRESDLVRAPRNLTPVERATLPVAALTAWHTVAEFGAVGPGAVVVVQTTGGVALFCMQFAVALGAEVVAVSRSAAKLARARELGVRHVIDTEQHPDWDASVLELTDGSGADLIVDMGLRDSLRTSARAASYEAAVAIVGVVQEQTNPLDIFPVMNKNLSIRGVETGSRAMFERMIAFIETEDLHPVIDSVLPAQEWPAGLDRLASSPFGKVVLDLSASAP
ncbi:zinc-binding dehydrogenase [Amnibacterium kyonggiense]